MSLLSRARQALSAAGSKADVDPHTWRLPSSYSASKPDGKQTVIPNPRVFSNAFIPGEPAPGNLDAVLAYPDVSHAAVHLALLECFWNLRVSAGELDVEVNRPPAYEEKPRTTGATAAPGRLPESQRWDLLVSLAVTRFAAWWSSIRDVLNHAGAYTHHASDKVAVQLATDQLPPLDVLLVWYVFLLDTDAYNAASRDRDPPVPGIQHLCFPWPAIRDVIDMERMQYVLPRTAEILFSTLSGQSADILTYLESPPAYADHVALPLPVDLAAEVKKHELFINEAHELLWVRSPSLHGSLARASGSYLDFQLRAAATWAGEELPFGIELLWRTHKLFPNQYAVFLLEVRGEEEDEQDQGGGSDSKAMRHLLSTSTDPGFIPARCYCWTCERIRDDAPTFDLSTPQSTPTSPTSPSSSSAVPKATNGQLSSLSSDQIRQIQDDLGFYNAVESARSRGKTLPTRPPTAAEKEADKIGKQKQKEVGYRPGLSEYTEVLPDGTRKIRRQKNLAPYGNGLWTI